MVNQRILTYRNYEPGDEGRILGLFKEVFHREMSPVFWRWRYEESPWGHGMVRVALDEDKMVGHFGVIPMRVQFQSTIYPAVFPMTAMTHPDYAGWGIFTRLMSETYWAARERGFPLVYGFFNQNSYYANVKFGYHGVITLNPLEKKLSLDVLDGHPTENITAIDTFGGAFDKLWDTVKRNYDAVVPRTSELLNWRFVKDPDVDYARFAYRDSRNEVLGYIVLKIYREGETARGHIVDLMTGPDESITRALIKKSYDYFRENRVSELSCWVKENTSYARILEEEGFVRYSGETHFAVMVLDKTKPELLPAEDAARWFLTMGDSDVY
jgi:GNAT superfamily N-acetyltransferase